MPDYSPLETMIRKQIATSGPMPVSRYMQLCLTHPDYGYYLKRDPLGRGGDFITAPEVSQMFGELVGLWAASVWNAMGMPHEVKFIELGPGRGTMMADALRAVRILPAFHEAISVHLVEASPTLREKQREKLADAAYVEWYDSIDDVPEGPAIILANEFFDALPIHQAVKQDDGWHERTIEIDDDILAYGVAKDPIPRFEVLLPPVVRAAPNGAIFEWRPDNEIMTIARRLRDQGGAALIIDYGHLRSDAGDTFQAVAKHAFANPLKNAGLADVTAHVDFQALARAAEDVGARAHGAVEQGAFLNRLGIENRAQALMKNATEDGQKLITAGLSRLTGPSPEGMGSLFKVLGVSHPSIETLAALSDHVPAAGVKA
ncbi:MAG: class I SAM-dependent methyltransferase [Afipia sp.]